MLQCLDVHDAALGLLCRLDRSFVMSVTARCAAAACVLCSTPSAMTIWLFHSGIVFTSVDCIFSAITVSLPCTSRICGAVCKATVRVSSRSCSFFSKRSMSPS